MPPSVSPRASDFFSFGLDKRPSQATTARGMFVLPGFGGEGATDPVHDVFRQICRDDAANVIGAKDVRIELQPGVERRNFFRHFDAEVVLSFVSADIEEVVFHFGSSGCFGVSIALADQLRVFGVTGFGAALRTGAGRG